MASVTTKPQALISSHHHVGKGACSLIAGLVGGSLHLLACLTSVHFDRTVSTPDACTILQMQHTGGLDRAYTCTHTRDNATKRYAQRPRRNRTAMLHMMCELTTSIQCFVRYQASTRVSLMRLSGSHDHPSATANGLSVES
eukprot:7029-Heterococcus_DN1.PRE.2